jgi:hypothetical protein
VSDILPTAELAWTQDLPKVDGFYWVMLPLSGATDLEKICVEADGQVFGFELDGEPGGTWRTEEHKYWYYGPIPVPTIPAELMVSHPMFNSTGKGMS